MSNLAAIEPVLGVVLPELLARGAEGVALVGSYARGRATSFSDVDLYAVGAGAEYAVRRVSGLLVTVSWRTAEQVRHSFVDLPGCRLAIPAWRSALALSDDRGVVRTLIDAASQWDWSHVPDRDAWCRVETQGFVEEVQKVRGALAAGDGMSATIWRNVLAMKLAPILAIRLRLLHEREEDTWPAVSAALGEPWASTQRRALGLDGADLAASCAAAIRLWELATAEVAQ